MAATGTVTRSFARPVIEPMTRPVLSAGHTRSEASPIKILIHTNHPDVGSGYGSQARDLIPRLGNAGHDVAISAFYGCQSRMSTWRGFPVYPSGDLQYGSDVVGMHAIHFGADLILTLMDQWALEQATMTAKKVACWMPVDAWPLSRHDLNKLPGRIPVTFSRFGQQQLLEAGLKPLYVPHGIDTEFWRPPEPG